MYYAPKPFVRKKIVVQKEVYAEDLDDAIVIALVSTTVHGDGT
jgi:hypothetical protein